MGKNEVDELSERSRHAKEFLARHFEAAYAKYGQEFLIEFRLKNSAGAILSDFCHLDEIPEIIEGPLLMNEEEGWHVYFGINPRPLSREKQEDDISYLLCFWVDLDVGEGKPHKTLEEAEARVRAFSPPPTLIIYSGGGLHVYWYLIEPIPIESSDQREKLKSILRGLIRKLDGDDAGSSLERVLRLPGTINHKNGKLCRMKPDASDLARRYTVADFEPLADSNRQPAPARDVDVSYPGINIAGVFAETSEKAAGAALFQLDVSERIKELIRSGSIEGYPSRSERDFSIIMGLLKKPYDYDTIRAIFSNKFYGCSDRIREKGERYLSDEVCRALKKRGKGEYDQRIEYPAQTDHGPKPHNNIVTPGPKPVLISLDSVVATPVRWLWENRIPIGKISDIVGNPGDGKSYLALFIGARVTRGDSLPDSRIRTYPGSVIVLTAEDGLADTVKPRALRLGADVSKIKVLDGVMRPGSGRDLFNLQKDVGALELALQEIGDVRLIIIDPLTAYLGGADSHKNAEVRQVLAPLAALAEQYDVAVLGINHLNKNSALEAIHRAMGSVAFVATARAVWAVVRDHEDESKSRRFFVPVKTNLSINPTTLAFRIVADKVVFEKEPIELDPDEAFSTDKGQEAAMLSMTMAWLKDLLQDGPKEAREITRMARENQITVATLTRAKVKLGIKPHKEGREQGCRWNWRLPNTRGA